MKKYILYAFALIVVLSGCSVKVTEIPESEVSENVRVSFVLGGEITQTEMPMSRTYENPDLYGIQIYKNGVYYKYGLFDNTTAMNTNLLAEGTYRFQVTLLKNGREVISFFKNPGDLHIKTLDAPFHPSGHAIALSNYFSSNESFSDLSSITRDEYYKCVDRYYGELDNYKPKDNDVISIDLKHVVFGLKTEVKNIPDGSVQVDVSATSNGKSLFSKSGIVSDFSSDGILYECSDIKSAWQYPDSYTESAKVHVVWTRSVGVVQDLGTKTLQLQRNRMNVIRVSLSADDGNAKVAVTTDSETYVGNESADVELNNSTANP